MPRRAGLPVEDADSTPDDTPGNDAGGNVNSASDDVTSGDGTGALATPDRIRMKMTATGKTW